MKKVLITTSTFAAADPTPLQLLSAQGFQIVKNPYGRKLKKVEVQECLSDSYIVGLIAGLETLDHEVLTQSSLKVISRVGAGVTNIDFDAAKRLGIKIFSTPDAPTNAVAELTIGAMLSLLRKIPLMNHELHGGVWSKIIGSQLEGKTAVIVGGGRIGLRVAEILKVFGAKLIIVDPNVKNVPVQYQHLTLHEALPLADIVSIHVNGEDEIIGAKELPLLKPGVFILNAARGGVINEDVLLGGLDQNKIAGAWIDTFLEEPYSGKLLAYPQVLLTPHVGSLTYECRYRMEIEAVNNLLKGFKELGLN